jgi:hypothetical protein
MKKRSFTSLVLAGVAASAVLYANDPVAWEKKTPDKCVKESGKADESSFASSLSPYTYGMYKDFTPDQKKRAMDFADHNKMSPDDAVMKVAGKK